MLDLLQTLLAFIVALVILIAVHEWGHYRMAVACGVKVLRFSIGMGKPILRWKKPGGETEFTLSMLPIGGFVQMLDAREGPVAPEESHRAFGARPLAQRAAIVAAGPAANLILAIALYALLQYSGVMQPVARMGAPAPQTLAAAAGLRAGDEVLAWAAATDDSPPISPQTPSSPNADLGRGWNPSTTTLAAPWQPLRSFEELRWALLQSAVDQQDVWLWVRRETMTGTAQSGEWFTTTLALSHLDKADVGAALMARIGIERPWMPPVIEGVAGDDTPAARAGLQAGDWVRSVDGTAVHDAATLRTMIAQSGADAAPAAMLWTVERSGQTLQLHIQPEAVPASADGRHPAHGRIGAYIGQPPEMRRVVRGPLEGLAAATGQVWDIARMSLQVLGRMLIGQASLDNLSSPIMIADHAGRSASHGWQSYVAFLALVSVSLGVLNLLPLPVLDGGHLMYYLWEAITGKPLREKTMEILQKIGIGILLLMMIIAVYNDIQRLWLN